MDKTTINAMEKVLIILLVIFGLYLLVQIVRKIIGGSWTTEDIILGLLILNLGSIITIGTMMAQLRSDHDHLKTQFYSLANYFKSSKKS